MFTQLIASLALAVSSAAATQPKGVKPVRIQFAFYHFKNDRVRISVNGETVFDRAVTVSPDNMRNGLAAVAQISIPACADIVVMTKRHRIAQRLCRTAATKSIVVDGGPPLTVVASDRYQGLD